MKSMRRLKRKSGDAFLAEDQKALGLSFRSRPVFLMGSLFTLLLVYPFFEQSGFGRFVLNGVFSLIMFSAAWAVHEKRIWLLIACVLGIPWIVLNWAYTFTLSGMLHEFVPETALATAALTSHILFIGFVEYSMFVAILRDYTVTSDTLYRAISGYLLLGLLWAAAYSLVGHYDMNAFVGAFTSGDDNQISWNNYLYFSYVTLSTLGYGDITPVSSHARSLAVVEMVVGPLYLAVVIARLVGMYSSTIKNEQ